MRVDLQSAVVPFDAKIVDALKVIDRAGHQVAVVVDDEGRLKGIITDGDVRRGLLRGVTLDAGVTEILNPRPVTAVEGEDNNVILHQVRRFGMHHLPVVDKAGKLVALDIVETHKGADLQLAFVLLMAGGLGTRLRPLTDTVPKPLIPVGNKPILEWTIDHLANQGMRRFYISVNYKSDMIEAYFGNGERWGIEIEYLRENSRLGTAGALTLLPEVVGLPFLVMNGDIMTSVNMQQMVEYHTEQHSAVTIGAFAYEHQMPYGVLEMDGNYVSGIQEKPVIRKYISGGIYVLSPETLGFVNLGEALDMPDLIQRMIASGQKIAAFPIREYWLDIGRHDDLKRANEDVQEVVNGRGCTNGNLERLAGLGLSSIKPA